MAGRTSTTREQRLAMRLKVAPGTLLIAVEFKRGFSMEDLATRFGITEAQVEEAIRQVMCRID